MACYTEELLAWQPKMGPVDWSAYEWVDEAPAPAAPVAVQAAPLARLQAEVTPAPPRVLAPTGPRVALPPVPITPPAEAPPSPPHLRDSSASPIPLPRPRPTRKRARLSDDSHSELEAHKRQARLELAAVRARLVAKDKADELARQREEELERQQEADRLAAERARAERTWNELRTAWEECAAEPDPVKGLKLLWGQNEGIAQKHEDEVAFIRAQEARSTSREGGVEPSDVPASQDKPLAVA